MIYTTSTPNGSRIKLSVSTDNAAFYDDHTGEYSPMTQVAQLKSDARKGVAAGFPTGTLRDINGNTVGSYISTGEAAE